MLKYNAAVVGAMVFAPPLLLLCDASKPLPLLFRSLPNISEPRKTAGQRI
jgi:hypothetical protein